MGMVEKPLHTIDNGDDGFFTANKTGTKPLQWYYSPPRSFLSDQSLNKSLSHRAKQGPSYPAPVEETETQPPPYEPPYGPSFPNSAPRQGRSIFDAQRYKESKSHNICSGCWCFSSIMRITQWYIFLCLIFPSRFCWFLSARPPKRDILRSWEFERVAMLHYWY